VKRVFVIALLAVASILSLVPETEAARRVVVRTRTPRGMRTRVVVRPGFPIRRTLPNVVIRTGVVRVAPRVNLGAVAFTAVTLATLPPPDVRVWSGSEKLEREDGWTDFTLDTDRRGERLVLEVEKGAAQVSFAEVVFENGEAQVVDFNDKVLGRGYYSLLDFKDGRKVDHVRVVAQASSKETEIKVHLVS
jgi:hypothetical protein